MDRILVVDDEQDVRRLIRVHLERAGLHVTEANSGRQAIHLMQQSRIELMILDLMMDDGNGFEVLRYLRKSHLKPLIIAVSARSEVQDKVETLGLGADDYTTKPFSPIELLARVQAHLRRQRPEIPPQSAVIQLNQLMLNVDELMLYNDGKCLSLTPIECELLKLFMQNPDRILTKRNIYEHVWQHTQYDSNNLSVYISRLRTILGDTGDSPIYLKSVRGIGYRFSGDGL